MGYRLTVGRFVCIILATVLSADHQFVLGEFDYKDALHKSILFLEAQRSGKLPSRNRISWRGDSAVTDGHMQNVDLVGGYYDAGDNVKYGLPMAFTVTMLAWGALHYEVELAAARELENARNAIRWGTDYFIKASATKNQLWVQVGDPIADHSCWQNPERMDTPRTLYKIDKSTPGTEIAAETAAALSASSIVFLTADNPYSHRLLKRARLIFRFADQYRGIYDGECPFYCSVSGYDDELAWAASWLYRATGLSKYTKYILQQNFSTSTESDFSWDLKSPGVQVLMSRVDYILGKNPVGMSFMVGFGDKYPQQAHHRGSSIVSIYVESTTISCTEGFMVWFHRTAPNPNELTGAVVGGPDRHERFEDCRADPSKLEPTTYINAPLVGVLAKLHSISMKSPI